MPAGCEMDALVAEQVMGWHPIKDDEIGLWWKVPENQNPSGFGSEDAPPPYSTHIEFSWEIVEKIHLLDDRYLTETQNDGEQIRWGVYQFMSDGSVTELVLGADTAPLAICRAALKAAMR